MPTPSSPCNPHGTVDQALRIVAEHLSHAQRSHELALRLQALPPALHLAQFGVEAGHVLLHVVALAGVQQLAGDATLLFYMTEEAQHGRDAYKEKRKPDFRQFPKRP